MKDINTVTVSGRLTRDGELKFTNGGFAILNFSLASNYSKKVGDSWEEQANFFDCVVLGKRGESLAQYLTKGQQVMVSGEIRQDRWEKDGEKKSRISIIANDIVLAGGQKQAKADDYGVGEVF